MFLEFPGVLITIGVALLILAIIIGIVAYKSEAKEEYDEIDESEEIKEETTVSEGENVTSSEVDSDATLVTDTKQEEVALKEEASMVENDVSLESDVDASLGVSELALKQEEMYQPVGVPINPQVIIEDEEEEIELL